MLKQDNDLLSHGAINNHKFQEMIPFSKNFIFNISIKEGIKTHKSDILILVQIF